MSDRGSDAAAPGGEVMPMILLLSVIASGDPRSAEFSCAVQAKHN